jgi:hypothetical protein
MKMSARAALSVLLVLLAAASISILGSCGSSSSPTTYTYAATSSVGDFIQWTLDSTAGTFNVTWNVTDSSNNVTNTFTLSGTCGAPDPTYDYRQCTVTTTSDSTSVQVGAVYDVLEVPGVAVFAHPETTAGRGNGTGNDEIHVGFTLDANACSNVTSYAGDYVMTHVAPVSNPNETERVGVYTLTSSFLSIMNTGSSGNVLHAGFHVEQNGGPFRMVYGLGDDNGNNNGTFNGESPFTMSCSGGILKLVGPQMTEPGVITSSGLFMFDGPQTFGGIVAAKTSVMATIDDLANSSVVIVWQNRNLVGSCSSSGGCTDLLKVTFGAKDSTGKVPATFSSLRGNTIPSINFRAASDPNAGTRFTSVNSGYTNNSVMAANYPEPANIPGLFYSDETSSGQETPTMLIVAKINGKLLVFGGNSTLGTGSGPNATMCAASTTAPSPTGDQSLKNLVCEPESGNFIGFQP